MGMNDADGSDGSAFRELVDGLLAANLERVPDRARVITRREAAALVATDADVAVTIQLLPGAGSSFVVHTGEDPFAEIVVRATGAGLLGLAATPLRLGLPDPASATGRRVIGDVLRRRIRVRGLVRHAGTLRRLSMLLSVR